MNESAEEIRELFAKEIQFYLAKKIDGTTFQKRYMDLWRQYANSDVMLELDDRFDGAIDRIFTALDCFCEDPLLRSDDDLDDEQLRTEVIAIARDLLS